MKKKIKNYKYICHIHTKKSLHKLLLGPNWREYIYDNLIGSREIISEILNDFEKNEKLGFIFPEAYYDIIKGIFDFDNSNFALHIYNAGLDQGRICSIRHIARGISGSGTSDPLPLPAAASSRLCGPLSGR